MFRTALSFLLLGTYILLSAQINYSANDIVTPYTGGFRAGVNFGEYSGFDEIQQADLSAGNKELQLPGVGVKAIRPALYEEFMEFAGYEDQLETYQHYLDLGLEDNTLIVGFPSDEHRDPNFYCPIYQSTLFANMYEPIWDDGENGTPINEDNYYALYLYKTATLYQDYVRFWEIWNEPGFDYTGAKGWFPPGTEGNWWDNNPDPCDYKLRAPIFHYVRLLRISWEVIKTVDPDAYIVVSGTGFPSFLDAILRNTDNPEDGSMTSDFPLKGGAYFDVMGFHSYPHFDGSLRQWNDDINDWDYFRHSDAAAHGLIASRDTFQLVLEDHGYDGTTYPKKQWLITECNLPRKQFGEFIGSEEAQRNFIPKAVVQCMKNEIWQLHLYKLAEDTPYEEATFEFDLMGLYQKLNFRDDYFQTPTSEGVVYATTSQLLFNKVYDEVRTAQLELPDEVGGGAFSDEWGNYTYILWAKTHVDQSETVSTSYSFPESLNLSGLIQREWDYSKTHTINEVNPEALLLTGTPAFFTEKLFSADSMFGCMPFVTSFVPEPVPNADKWEWTFEGGNPSTSQSSNPIVSFHNSGQFAVTLQVKDQNNNTLANQTQYIQVENTGIPSFEYDISGPIVFLNNTSTLNTDEFLWDFGDGTTSNVPSPMHVFYESGEYTIVLSSSNECGIVNQSITVNIAVPSTTLIEKTANDIVPPYTAPFRPGSNFKFYPNWQDEQLADIAAGNIQEDIPGVGVKAFRSLLPHYFLDGWGYDIRLSTYQHYQNLGIENNTAVIGIPDASVQDTMRFCPDYQSTVFQNIYLDIWDDGLDGTPINEENDYANYLYQTVNTYKDFVTFWEIWNSPGFDHSGEKGWLPPGEAGNWWENNPDPCDYELRAPIFYYVRLLRISYEIIKTLDEDAYITVSGIGFPSFLDAILRNTDNPADGSIKSGYPLKGGAYFDAVGFNTFPHIDGSTSYFDLDLGTFAFRRHSDAAIMGISNSKEKFEAVLNNYGYDGNTYPEKVWIIGESNVPRKTFGDFIGSVEAQRNFILKAYVEAVINDIKQFNVFSLAEDATYENASSPTQVMGLYETLHNVDPYHQTPTDEGIAYKTISDVLFGKNYDAAKTEAMNLPENIRGAAFKTHNEHHIYILWAKTTIDQSEEADAVYSFPSNFGLEELFLRQWDWSVTDVIENIEVENIELTGTPIFLSETAEILPAPVASFSINETEACAGTVLQLTDLSQNATAWEWSFPGSITESSSEQNPTVVYDNPGLYTISLTATNGAGSHNATYIEYIQIVEYPVANFDFEMDAPWVAFTNHSDNATSYYWDFDDNTFSEGFNPNHFFFHNGTYEVTLIASNACGVDSITQTVEIAVPPTARLEPTLVGDCEDFTVKFLNNSYSSPNNWEWFFPDAIPPSSLDFNPTTTFPSAGVYPVTLVVSNEFGSDVITEMVTVGPIETAVNPILCSGESLEFNGTVYDENNSSGVHLFENGTELGCDSIVHVEVSFLEAIPPTFLVDTIDIGESYSIGNSIYNETGMYEDVLVAANGCDSLVFLDLTVLDMTNIWEIENQPSLQLRAFPNPFQQELFIHFELKKRERIHLEVFDSQGRLVEKLLDNTILTIGEQVVILDKDNLGNGVFWVRVQTENFVESIRVVHLD